MKRDLTLLLGTASLFGFLGAVAQAQETPATTSQPSSQGEPLVQEKVVVTGSNIAGASDSGAIAVTILDSEQLAALGATSTGEILESLPQAGAYEINGAADGPNDARGDVATVNLRGLGTGNSLVLLNGRRMAFHAVNQDIGSTPRQIVNVNAFPQAGIDRVEVLRDGASALYGADATAGVVNTILSADTSRGTFDIRKSWLENTDHSDLGIDFSKGFEFNEDRTRVLLVGSYFERNGLFASELGPQFNSVDKRTFLGDSPFGTDTVDFRNTSTSSPFGQFRTGSVVDGVFVGQRARIGNTNVTTTSGTFHIQPCSFPGTVAELGDFGEGCVGVDDNTLDIGLRYDFNNYQPNNALNQGVNITNSPELQLGRQFISETERRNFYALGEHDFTANITGFAEVLFYQADTFSSRAPQPLDSGLAFLIIPRTNYWNPFGATTSPNRIPGLRTSDVPEDGLDVLLSNWRPTDLGPRFIATETETYRVLAGVRGEAGKWDWESALAISGNTTTDTESNRLSKTLLAAELAKSTPDAINPFGGPNANTQEQWNRARISSTNSGETELTTWDFRASNSEVFSTWAGDVGVAGGVEWRQESYLEDRDPRLDGTITFDTSTVSGISDVVGVSPTRDSAGERNVFSAFGEALIPLYRGEGTFKNDLTLQIAARAEHFDDIEETVLKPKVALSWFPVSSFNLRAAYSQGFRAPNLPQLSRGDVSRLNLGRDDYYRLPVLPDDPNVNGSAYLADVRQSNPNLENEDTETVVLGAVADLVPLFNQDWISDFRVSLDYWQFEQTDLVGVFGVNEALAFDALLRLDGSSNPNVVRAAPTADEIAAFAAYNAANPNDQRVAAGQVLFVRDPYINLDKQTADGFDLGIATEFDLGEMGEISVDVETTYLQTLEIIRNDLLTALAANPEFDGVFDFIEPDRIAIDGNPQWRSTATFGWRIDDLRFGGSVRYVSDFEDINADVDTDGDGVNEQFIVEDNVRVNLFGEVRLPGFGPISRTQVRLGINNVFDEPPPLADESLGYRPDYHSLKGREIFVTLGLRF